MTTFANSEAVNQVLKMQKDLRGARRTVRELTVKLPQALLDLVLGDGLKATEPEQVRLMDEFVLMVADRDEALDLSDDQSNESKLATVLQRITKFYDRPLDNGRTAFFVTFSNEVVYKVTIVVNGDVSSLEAEQIPL